MNEWIGDADQEVDMSMLRKLGPHIQRSTPAAVRWARKAWVVKSLDDVGPLREARPGAITIYRKYYPYQDTSRHGAEVAAEIVASLGGFRPTYVELYNEHEATLATGLRQHALFTRQATDYLHAHGYKVLGFSFNMGAPEPEDWAYLRAVEYAGVDAIGLHQYRANEGWSQWRGLRHRLVHAWTEGEHPPFIISECGRDRVIEEGAPGRGWREHGISAEQYLAELVEYDRLLDEDDYVLGAVVFTAGPFDDWRDFDVDEFADRVEYEDTPPWGYAPPPTAPGGRTMDQLEAALRDMWKRQGVEPPAEDGFWKYALAQAGQGKLVYPLPSKDGNWQNHDHPRFARALTVPPLWCEKGVWQVKEGFPPF